MPATKVQQAHGRSSGAVTSFTAPALGSNVTEGNCLVCIVARDSSESCLPTATGYRFSRVRIEAFSDDVGFSNLSIFVTRVPATTSAPTITWTTSASQRMSAITIEYSGVTFSRFAFATAEQNTTTTPGSTIVPVTAYQPGLLLAVMSHKTAASPAITPPGGWTEEIEQEDTSSGMPYSVVTRTAVEGDAPTPQWTLGTASASCVLEVFLADAPPAETSTVQIMGGGFTWQSNHIAVSDDATHTLFLGFRPKAILVVVAGDENQNDQTLRGNVQYSFGVVTDNGGSPQNVQAGCYINVQSSLDSQDFMRSDACAVEALFTGAETPGSITAAIGDVETVLTIGNEANFGVNFNWLAIGGTDVSAAKVVQTNVPASTGDLDVTGFGFTPDANATLICFGVRNDNASLPYEAANASPWIGVYANGSQIVQLLGDLDGGSAGDTVQLSYNNSGSCVAVANAAMTDVEVQGAWSAWISDGVRINFTEVAGQHKFFALIIQGGKPDLTISSQRTTTGLFTPTGNLNKRSSGLLAGGTNRVNDAAGTPVATTSNAGGGAQFQLGLATFQALGTFAYRYATTFLRIGGGGARGRSSKMYDRLLVGLDDTNTPVNGLDVEVVTPKGFQLRQEVADSITEQFWVWSLGQFEQWNDPTWNQRNREGKRPRPYAPGSIR